jgi:hypothetical protein
MGRIMVRYTVKPELAETNAELVRAVYEERHKGPVLFALTTWVWLRV